MRDSIPAVSNSFHCPSTFSKGHTLLYKRKYSNNQTIYSLFLNYLTFPKGMSPYFPNPRCSK